MLRIVYFALVASAMVVASFAASSCKEDPCKPNPCKNGGECLAEPHEGRRFRCDCGSLYTGSYCEVPTDCVAGDPCSPSPCRNNGKCEPSGNGGTGYERYKCTCADGFQGFDCEVAVEAPAPTKKPTVAPTTTREPTTTPEPTPEPEVTFPPEDLPTTPGPPRNWCEPNPCINFQKCENKTSQGKPYTCYCPPKYTGCKCDREKPSQCPSGFVYLSEPRSCYAVITALGTWSAQAAACKALRNGTDLAVITTEYSDWDVVKRLKTSVMSDPNTEEAKRCTNGFYVGAQRKVASSCSSDFVWKTIGTCETPLNYHDWAADEPNCSSSKLETCAILDPTAQYKWKDVSCGKQSCALCELVIG